MEEEQALLVAGDVSEFAFAEYGPNGQFENPIVVLGLGVGAHGSQSAFQHS